MAGEFSMDISGADQLRAVLESAGPKAIAALTEAMVTEMESVIADAKRLTPVDTGVLRASGTVLPPEVDGASVEVTGGFGGAASAYSIPVHENLGAAHPNGAAKFLEKPVLEHVAVIGEAMAKRVAAALAHLKG